jgi:hypothetical protein
VISLQKVDPFLVFIILGSKKVAVFLSNWNSLKSSNFRHNINPYRFLDTNVVKNLELLETNDRDLDRYDVRKLYPDATSDRVSEEWFFDMEEGSDTERLDNHEDANLRREDDGSWSVTGARKISGDGDNARWDDNGQVRLEGWSESGNKKWRNMEITVYACYDKDLEGRNNDGERFTPGPYAFQLYGRGGHHGTSHDERCDAACYKIGLRMDGNVEVRKEPTHGCFLPDQGRRRGTEEQVRDRWIGLKQVLYNFRKDGRTCVANEIWIDDRSHDNGRLADPPRNRWRHVVTVIDTGRWGGDCNSFVDDCDRLDGESDGRRRKKHIISEPGGPRRGNIGALRSDEVKLKFKFFSIREIQPPEPAEDAIEAEAD